VEEPLNLRKRKVLPLGADGPRWGKQRAVESESEHVAGQAAPHVRKYIKRGFCSIRTKKEKPPKKGKVGIGEYHGKESLGGGKGKWRAYRGKIAASVRIQKEMGKAVGR